MINRKKRDIKQTTYDQAPKKTRARRSGVFTMPTKDSLKIYCLGGQEEVGRNCTVFEYGEDIIILDMGIQFPDEDMPGIDYIIPNISSLERKKKNIRGIIFTHGHLDHIGAAPLLLEKLGNPIIIGRPLTLAIVKNRQEDYKKNTAKNLKTLPLNSINQKITLGKFKISFFQVEHSIMDAIGVVVRTPHGTVIHPGDWSLESDPANGRLVTYTDLAKLPAPRILMLESLGSTTTKARVSTRTTLENLSKLINAAPGRVIIGTFSSQIERIKHLLEYAEKIGKKVALDGFSIKMNVEISKKLGYIKAHKNTFIGVDKISQYPNNKIIIICTGAQAERNASFARIVNGNHRYIHIQRSDTIIFSSSIIPGNEASIQKLKDNIYRLTDNVVHSEIMDVHSSGHSTADDIKTVLEQINPHFFLPVYANYYLLVEAKKIALRSGIKAEQVHILENGQIVEFYKGKPKLLKPKVDTNYVMVDGLGVGDISQIVLRDRQVMSADGMIVVIATIDMKTGHTIGNPDIISRGFIYMKEQKDLVEKTRMKAKKIVIDNIKNAPQIDENYIKNKIRNDIGEFLFQQTQRRPMVLPVVIKV